MHQVLFDNEAIKRDMQIILLMREDSSTPFALTQELRQLLECSQQSFASKRRASVAPVKKARVNNDGVEESDMSVDSAEQEEEEEEPTAATAATGAATAATGGAQQQQPQQPQQVPSSATQQQPAAAQQIRTHNEGVAIRPAANKMENGGWVCKLSEHCFTNFRKTKLTKTTRIHNTGFYRSFVTSP